MKRLFGCLSLLLCFYHEKASGQISRGKTKTSIAYRNNYQRMEAGGYHTLEIRGGTLWAWGNNDLGQLGTGNNTDSNVPVQVGTDNRWVSVAAGGIHSLALKSDGTLWAWGYNAYGQLGTGNNNNSNVPVQVGTDNKWVSVEGADVYSFGLKSDGTLWAWGRNVYGQLGNGNNNNSNMPVQVGVDNKWVSVEGGGFHSLALKSDGTLWAWGNNPYGQLGTGNYTPSNVPVQVGSDNKWVSVSAGGFHSLALKSDGTLWAWGNNPYGQLGTGNNTGSNIPVQVGSDKKWVSMVGGTDHSLGLKSDGTLWAWGFNGASQLGTGNNTDSSVPVRVGTDNKWMSVAGATNHSLALKSDGTLWSWGRNSDGQLGTGNNTDSNVPVQAIGSDNKWVSVAGGYFHSLALKSDGTLWSWGRNSDGQLGTGNNTDSNVPVQAIGSDNKWVSVAGGYFHSLALKSDGTLWSWGRNSDGQLGTGNNTNSNVPVQVGIDNKWVSVAGGGYHSLAIKSDGTLWAWGSNNQSQLGNGNNTDSNVPVQVGSDNKWVSVAGGTDHSLALKSDGTLWAWGYNGYGELGTGNSSDSNVPVQVGTDNKWVSVSAGGIHSLALKSDGTLWAWGYNAYGQLGTGNNNNSNVPVQVGTDTKWMSVVGGVFHSLAFKNDGALWAWGRNNYGQLGTGNNTNSNVPVQVDSDVVTMAAGGLHSALIHSNHNSVCLTGFNADGQLGDGTNVSKNTFTCQPLPPVTYYSKAAGNLHELSTFGTNADGSGTPPPSFASGIFNLVNRGSVYTLTGNWTVNGTLNIPTGSQLQVGGYTLSEAELTGSGTLSGSLTSNLVVTSTAGSSTPLNFTPGAGLLNNLTLNRTGASPSATITATPLSLYGVLTITSGTLNTGGLLTLKSTAAGTARVAPVLGSVAGAVTVERYIPARRAWRILSAPVSGSQSINAAWQEGATSTSDNPAPGYGTFITGGSVADGFDQSPGATSSIKTYGSSVNNWVAVPSTKNTAVNANAFLTFVYGNRNANTIPTSAPATTTTLRATGGLKTGDQMFPVSPTGFTAVPNPFASPINFQTITRTNVANSFYLWDPKVGGTNGVGGYVTVSYNGTSYDVSSTAVSPESQYIQSGQGFLVSAIGANASVTIKESDKASGGSDNVFRTTAGVVSTAPVFADPAKGQGLRISLQAAGEDGTPVWLDEVFASYNATYANQVDKWDAAKAANVKENLGMAREGQTLVIERRGLPTEGDTIALRLWNTEQKGYLLAINPINIGATGLYAYLEDKYLKTLTPVSLSDVSQVSFFVTGDAASQRADRFSLILTRNGKPAVMEGAVTKGHLTAYPNPVVGNTLNLQFSNLPEGTYKVTFVNNAGQVVFPKEIQHAGGSSLQRLTLDKPLAAGVYQLQIAGKETKTTISIVSYQ